MAESPQNKFAETLTDVTHQDPDKHWIGESLPSPSVGEAQRIGTSNFTGDSPFPARADHNHQFDATVMPKTFNVQGINLTGTFAGEATVCTRSVAAQSIAGVLFINAYLRLEKTVATDVFTVTLYAAVGVALPFQCTQYWPLNADTRYGCAMTGLVNLPANTTASITIGVLRNSGTGTASVFTNYPLNHIIALWIPVYT